MSKKLRRAKRLFMEKREGRGVGALGSVLINV